jgi:hypothetical protein
MQQGIVIHECVHLIKGQDKHPSFHIPTFAYAKSTIYFFIQE